MEERQPNVGIENSLRIKKLQKFVENKGITKISLRRKKHKISLRIKKDTMANDACKKMVVICSYTGRQL